VILNLSIWFGLHILFGTVSRAEGWFRPWVPDWQGFDPWAAGLSALAALSLLRFHSGLAKTLVGAAAIGLVLKMFP
jgi:chromate transporter